jgi:hypothetical protein
MRHSLIAAFASILLLLGSPAVAQEPAKPAQTEGKSLGQPHHQQQADDAMNTESGRAGNDEPGSHAPTQDEPVLRNGALNVPGAPADSQTVPAKFSQHNAALDKLPTMAFPLSDDQKRAIADGVRNDGVPVAAVDPVITAELPSTVPLNDLPAAAAELPSLKGLKYVRLADRIVLVQAVNRVVVAEIR